MPKAATRVAQVTIYDASEKLPPKPKDGIGVMIIAYTEAGEWDILMYDHKDIGYGLGEDEFETRFSRWAYLCALDNARKPKKDPCEQAHKTVDQWKEIYFRQQKFLDDAYREIDRLKANMAAEGAQNE